MRKGQLTLVPTPISSRFKLEPLTKELLEQSCLESTVQIVCEDPKPARRRWLSFGLPREAIEKFHYLNEHSREEKSAELLSLLKKGHHVFLMSDCGLPCFCDPGSQLVSLCHDHKIKVSSTAFSNSISLALALSGFDIRRFSFEGFIPAKSETRGRELKRILKDQEIQVIMDTPYRYKKILPEIYEICKTHGIEREIFVATNLGEDNELIFRTNVRHLDKHFSSDKKEFIIVLGKYGR